ncbi:UNVERIFIED_CONTAM: hypothetical protein HDU68_009494 [Siphonaria sp. JEL0065]|nr:hypothetical protein HDU68_009494 [Siphonaria sp. JEL0065]
MGQKPQHQPLPQLALPQLSSKPIKPQPSSDKGKKILAFPNKDVSPSLSKQKAVGIPKAAATKDKKPTKDKKKKNESQNSANQPTPAPQSEREQPDSPPSLLSPKPKSPILGTIQVLYNHYHDHFQIKNGVLAGDLIDEKYAFSFVHKGNFKILLLDTSTNEYMPKLDSTRWDFQGCIDGGVYRAEIEMDPEEEKRLDARPPGSYGYKAPKTGGIKSANAASDLITRELKGMTKEELEAKGDRYKELIEARELEDALFS